MGDSRKGGMRRTLWLACIALAVGPLLTGCEQAAPARPAQAAEVELGSAEAAVRSLFTFADKVLAATAREDRAAAKAALRQIHWHIAAHDAMAAYHRTLFGDTGVPVEEALRSHVKSWVAMINYYADGVELDDMRVVPSEDAARRTVLVTAEGPDDTALFRIRCVRDDAGVWRVRALGFAGPVATHNVPVHTRPASRPAP